ncbi:parathyroid hormone-like [Oryzias latipes]|uniref:parathyroid hormone-like n=1 Tax=Oryzias latipes TaxID=8090 RepID=UPI0002A4BB06|nr:parathyroid hormone-like [Oryzias latipes]
MRPKPQFDLYQAVENPSSHQIIKIYLQGMDYRVLLISLCILHFSIHCQGRPLSKRTVSEMQLMHNLGQQKQVEDRREWLLMRVRGIHNPAGRRGGGGDPAEARRRRRLTAEDIRDALDLLEHLLEPKQA